MIFGTIIKTAASFVTLTSLFLSSVSLGNPYKNEYSKYGYKAKFRTPILNMVVGPGSFELSKPVLRPFSTDGCSYSPDNIPFDKTHNWVHCCIKHDLAYWIGGSSKLKDIADKELGECVAKNSTQTIGRLYEESVKVGGTPYIFTTFRWGYGWNKIRGYKNVSPTEFKQAQSLYGENLEVLEKLIITNSFGKTFQLYDPASLTIRPVDNKIYDFLNNNLKEKDQLLSIQKYFFPKELLMKNPHLLIKNLNLLLEIKLSRCPNLIVLHIGRDQDISVFEDTSECLK